MEIYIFDKGMKVDDLQFWKQYCISCACAVFRVPEDACGVPMAFGGGSD